MSTRDDEHQTQARQQAPTDEKDAAPVAAAAGADPGARSREATIVRTSVLGIGANVLLAAFKAVVGMLTHSIAVTMDAVNNLSDAMSSVITIVGTKLAGKAPDKNHPLGYGRVEYLSATVISIIVLYAGVSSLIESVKGIVSPQTPSYTTTSLVIIAAAVVVKLVLGRHVKATGERVGSDSLVASGADALFDAVLSASTLAAAAVFITTGFAIEAWVGAAISVVIVKSGLDMLRDTLSQILGERADAELAQEVRRIVSADPDANGAYDLVLHSYGPEQLVGSVHTEVADTLRADCIDEMTRRIQHAVYAGTNGRVILAAVGIYSRNTSDDVAMRMRSEVTRMVMAHDGVIQMHGFHVDEKNRLLDFDVILDFALPDRESTYRQIVGEVQATYPDYKVSVTLDVDAAD
ncbi:cation diffusion facilitator family transporter [Parafannyhessea sp. LCP21S3_E6]|uniref:cation diffusion facilitator family transporter n=1 Tax=unclassified Parafannyhessea TaxID=2847323 RepID=UPI003F9BAB76